MFGWLIVAAPIALIIAVGAAVWLEGHFVEESAERAVPHEVDPAPSGPRS